MSKKAAIYARVSKDVQLGNYSIPTQLQACRTYAVQQGYDIVAEFVDAHTGEDFDRPEFNKLKKLAGALDAVIVYDTDRLSRDAVDMAIFNREFLAKGTQVEFVNFSVDTSTTMGQAFLFMQGIYAQEENAKRAERSERGKRARVHSGKVLITSIAPYGYDYNKETGELVINEKQAGIVRLIFHWYVYGDETGKRLGLEAIAGRLTKMGVPTKHDIEGIQKSKKKYGVWGKSSVHKIIRGEHYAGTWHYGRFKVGQTKTTRVRTDQSEWISTSVPPIISRELWEAAQKTAKDNAHYSKRNTKHEYLMRGRLVCATCGYTFNCHPDYRKDSFYYQCGGQFTHNSPDRKTTTCNHSLRQGETDERIWQAIVAMLLDPSQILSVLQERRSASQEQLQAILAYLSQCEKKLTAIESQRKKLLDLYLDGSFSKEILDEKLAYIIREEELYQDKKVDLEQRVSEMTFDDDQTEQIKVFCEMAAAGIELFGFEEQSMVIETLDVRGIVHLGETYDDDVIVLTGYIPEIEVKKTTEFASTLSSLREPSPPPWCAHSMPLQGLPYPAYNLPLEYRPSAPLAHNPPPTIAKD